MSVEVNVTPQVLLWARKSMGYSPAEVAQKMKLKTVTPEKVRAWEHGDEKLTYSQLNKIANIYKRPSALFFFPEPPVENPLEAEFRSLPKVFAQKLPSEIRYMVRKAMAQQIALQDLHNGDSPAGIKLFWDKASDTNIKDPKLLASQIREIVDVSVEEQLNWKTLDDALKNWRKSIENIGIWVFKDAFKNDDYCGFCLHDMDFPIIYINNSMPRSRQIFTLFHELGHLLIAKSGLDFRENVEFKFEGHYREDEVFCNTFAGLFLVPQDFEIPGNPSDQEVEECAAKYKVSREVILYRCRELNLIAQENFNEKMNKLYGEWNKIKKQRKTEKGGGNYFATKKIHLGDKYMTLAFTQYYKNNINEYQLADYLGIKANSLSELESYI